MKYRIIQVEGDIMIQEKGLLTFFRWRTLEVFGGSFGDEPLVFETTDCASAFIERKLLSSPAIRVIKTF